MPGGWDYGPAFPFLCQRLLTATLATRGISPFPSVFDGIGKRDNERPRPEWGIVGRDMRGIREISAGTGGGWGLPLVLLLVIVVYTPSLFGEFVCDDWPMIVENPTLSLSAPEALNAFFTKGQWENSRFGKVLGGLYRPILLSAFFLINTLFGPNPVAFHAALLALHVLNMVLVFCISRRIFLSMPDSFHLGVAAIFGLHPVQTHCVSWISGGVGVILGTFFLSAFLFYLRYREGRRWADLAVMLICLEAALLTKETALAYFPVVILYDVLIAKPRGRGALWTYPPMIAIFVLYLVLRGRIVPWPALDLTADGFRRLLEYLLLSFRFVSVPWPLPFYISYPPGGIATLPGIAVGLVTAAVSIYVGTKRRETLFVLAWFGTILLVPLSVAAFHGYGMFSIRFLYLPMVGAAFLLMFFIRTLILDRYITGVSIGLIVVLSGLTTIAARDWRNEEVFYRRVWRANPSGVGGPEGLGRYYERVGRSDEAIGTYARAIPMMALPKARAALAKRLALVYVDKGMFEPAITAYQNMLFGESEVEALTGIGNCLWMLGRNDEALSYYEKALQKSPGDFDARYNYASLNESMGRMEEARESFRRLLQDSQGKGKQEAIDHARKVLEGKGPLPGRAPAPPR